MTGGGNGTDEAKRAELLERYGRIYGDLGLAIAFTQTNVGDPDAKRVVTTGWDKTKPLADGNTGATLVKGRGQKRNPAVVLRRSGLIGVECDTVERLEEVRALELPRTVTVQSSEAYKLHFWFRPPNGTPPKYVAFRFEKDGITADRGRYLLVPPALHPSGREYAFIASPEDTEIAVLPEKKYAELVRLADESEGEQIERLEADPDAKILEGRRRQTIFRYACSQRAFGLSETATLEGANALNRERCEPQLSDEQVAGQVRGAFQYPSATALPTTAHAERLTVNEAQPEKPWLDSSRLVDGATFLNEDGAPVEPIWGDPHAPLMAAGEPSLLVGPEGVGKTTIAEQFMLARIGLLEQVLGLPVRVDERPVLYLAMDRPKQAARSLARMTIADDVLREKLIVWRGPLPFDITSDKGRPEYLAEFAVDLGAGTVIADSLKDFGSKIASDEVGSRINTACQELVASGVEFLGLHHQRKASTENKKPRAISDVYGSRWITAGMGSVVLLWGDPGDLAVELRHLKQPAEEVGPLTVVHDHDLGTSSVHDGVDILTVCDRKGGISAHTIATFMFGTDAPARNEVEKVRRKADRLAREGKLERREVASSTVGESSVQYRTMRPSEELTS